MKQFHLGDLISVATGRLFSPTGMSGVYDILNYMTNDSVSTFQIPRFIDECSPYMYERHPFLREIDVPLLDTREASLAWLGEQVAKYGEWFEVRPIHPEDHENLSIFEEAERMGLTDKMITIEQPSEEPNPYGDIDWRVDDDGND